MASKSSQASAYRRYLASQQRASNQHAAAVHQAAPAGPAKGVLRPPTPAPAPDPVLTDPYYDATVLSANRNIGLGNAEGAYQTGDLLQAAGYGQDAGGNLRLLQQGQTGYDPYSAAATYQKEFEESRRGTTNSYAAAGQLYSGAIRNAQGAVADQYARSSHDLLRQVQGGLHGIQQGRLQNYASNGMAVSDADWQALMKRTYGG